MTKTNKTWNAVGTRGTCTCAHRSADGAARCSVKMNGRLVAVVSNAGERRSITVAELHTGRVIRSAGSVLA